MDEPHLHRWPAIRGAGLALIAAALFGISTPLVQQLGAGVGPFSTAALLYAGAALTGVLLRRRVEREARVVRADLRRVLAIAAVGAVVGPVALAWGLQRTSATSASLMLTLESVFTAFLAWWLYRETMDRRIWTAMLLLVAGGVVLVLDQARQGAAQLTGLFAILVATAAWGLDNTLSRALAERDPAQVVVAKAALGSTATVGLALLLSEALPTLPSAIGLFVVGATAYGLSLRFYLLAQRAFGAARTGSVFAFAPFIGAALAVGLGDHSFSWTMGIGGSLMLAGVLLHLLESHGHEHVHEAMQHEHAHVHDDGHHDHVHEPMPEGPHSHVHRHESRTHSHPHMPDAHHTHHH